MFEIRVEADFAAAHFLKDYHGKCENLHGHNYKVYAHAKGDSLDDGGMLLDFGILKSALRKVCKKLDHSNLNELQENGDFVFCQNPSAERIAKWIFDNLIFELENGSFIFDFEKLEYAKDKNIDIKNEVLLKAKKAAKLLYAVDVFETETSRARYTK